MKVPRLAVIQFPGSNCEYETLRMAEAAGFETALMRWNCDFDALAAFDAYILPGGFSYQDRVRAGVIASRLPLMDVLVAADQAGKPILGICNGCQILAESGLVPNLGGGLDVEIGLAKNTQNEKPHGFMCDWVTVSFQHPEKGVFTRHFTTSDYLPIPINHGEGNFRLSATVAASLSDLAMIRYCTPEGQVLETSPTNPNGTSHNIAGLYNRKGNVLALMPHPERAFFLRQVPLHIGGVWADQKRLALQNPDYDLDALGIWSALMTSCYDSIMEGVLA